MSFNYADSCMAIPGYMHGECPECEKEHDNSLCDSSFGGSVKCIFPKGHSGEHYGKWSQPREGD